MNDVDELYQYLCDGKMLLKEKFYYDLDEESFFEEFVYEKLDDFWFRLQCLERGELGNQSSWYCFVDFVKFGLYKGVENFCFVGDYELYKLEILLEVLLIFLLWRYIRVDFVFLIQLN